MLKHTSPSHTSGACITCCYIGVLNAGMNGISRFIASKAENTKMDVVANSNAHSVRVVKSLTKGLGCNVLCMNNLQLLNLVQFICDWGAFRNYICSLK